MSGNQRRRAGPDPPRPRTAGVRGDGQLLLHHPVDGPGHGPGLAPGPPVESRGCAPQTVHHAAVRLRRQHRAVAGGQLHLPAGHVHVAGFR